MNGDGVPTGKSGPPVPQGSTSRLPHNNAVKNSVLDAMLAIVIGLCFMGVITFFIGLAILNNGIWLFSIKEFVESGEASTEILKGLVDLTIGIVLLFGSYLFVRYTVERKNWWQKVR